MNGREFHAKHRAEGIKVTFSCALCANDPEAAEQDETAVCILCGITDDDERAFDYCTEQSTVGRGRHDFRYPK